MEKFYLCKCNNCGTIMFDENPQVGAPKFELKGGEVDMLQLCDREQGGVYYWGCPVCQSDSYLTDLE